MSTQTFDTLAPTRDMERAGLKREAAEAVASAIRAGQRQGALATKADLEALGAGVRGDMYRVLLFQIFAIVVAVVALMKLIP